MSLIFDSDWWTDVDDVVALRVLDWAQVHKVINLKGVMLSTTFADSPGSLQSLMANDTVTGVPIGTSHTPNVPSGSPMYQADLRTRGISAGYITGSETYPDALLLYRTLLSTAPGKMDIVTTGELNNLMDLLLSPPDGISPLTGLQLVTAKVRHLWVMGGQNPSGTEYNFSNNALAIASSNYVVANWPTPITYSGFEVGNSVLVGASVSGLQPGDLLAQAMADFGSFSRPAWDPLNALLSTIGSEDIAGYSVVRGSNAVNAGTGANTFTPAAGARDDYVVKQQSDVTLAARINALILKTTW